MKVTIYQIVPELDNDHMMFRDFKNLCIACGGELPAECYEAVYTGEVNAVTLEDVYRIFNIEHPKGFRGIHCPRRMSWKSMISQRKAVFIIAIRQVF